MKRYTNLEVIAAIMGFIFIVVGIIMVIRPVEMAISPQGGRYNAILGPGKTMHLSKTGAEFSGGLSVVMGSCICWFALFAGRRR